MQPPFSIGFKDKTSICTWQRGFWCGKWNSRSSHILLSLYCHVCITANARYGDRRHRSYRQELRQNMTTPSGTWKWLSLSFGGSRTSCNHINDIPSPHIANMANVPLMQQSNIGKHMQSQVWSHDPLIIILLLALFEVPWNSWAQHQVL